MPLHVALTHRTSYRYDRLVQPGPQTIRLRPAPHARTPILAYELKVAPKPHFLKIQILFYAPEDAVIDIA